MLVLGPSDGRQQLTGVARSLCEQVQQHRLTSREVDINLLNNRLIGISLGSILRTHIIINIYCIHAL